MQENIDIKNKDYEKTHSNLQDRYTILQSLLKSYPSSSTLDDAIKEKLVVTDLFVERDIGMLQERADKLSKQATILFRLVVAIFIFAAIIATYQMLTYDNEFINWGVVVVMFIKSFTVYGLLILTGTTAWKHSKAKLDQAERLYAKRRHNRQLRLYLYLNNGNIELENMMIILEQWKNENNAFENIVADAKAPWGNVISELLKTQAEIANAMKSQKSTQNNE